MFPWLPKRNEPWLDGIRDDPGLNISSCPVCWDETGVGWFRCTGPLRLLAPAEDHIEAWFAVLSCALFDKDGNSLTNC